MVPQEICDKICKGAFCAKNATTCPSHSGMCCMECTVLGKDTPTCAPWSDVGMNRYFKFIVLYNKGRSFT